MKLTKEKIDKLKDLIIREAKLSKILNDKQTIFDKKISDLTIEFENETHIYSTNCKKFQEEIRQHKEILTMDAKEDYLVDGIKQRIGGIGIRVLKDIVYDEIEAFNWAKEHQLCLKLDKTAFKNIAKIQDIEFVGFKEKISVAFPKIIKEEI